MSGVAKHDALKERLRRLPRPLLVGLDVDGTLAPIVADPAAARIPEATQQLLRKLAKREGLIVALLTGRDLPALRRMGSVAGAWRGRPETHPRGMHGPGQGAANQRTPTHFIAGEM